MRARRIAALWLPGIPLQAVGRDDPAMRERPVAITDGAVVLARNRCAVAAGVAAGMTLAEAATHAPGLTFVTDDPRRTQALWDAVLDHLGALGEVVEDAGPGLALVDLTGAGRTEPPVRRTLRALQSLHHLTARAGVADGPFVAAIAARRASDEPKIVPVSRSAAFLAPLPVAVLPLPAQAVADLALLGIRTVAGFAGLRLSDVQRRYGIAGMAALTLASGRDDRPLVPRVPERRETLTHPFDPPVDDTTPVLFVSRALLDNHAAILRREGLVAHGLRLALAIECGESVTVEQRWGTACIPGAAEFDALRLALAERLTGEVRDGALPPRVEAIAVTLIECVPDRGTQLPLFDADTVRQREEVAHLLTRLHALLGPMDVVEDVLIAAHAPEKRWRSRPYDVARVGIRAVSPAAASPSIPIIPGMIRLSPPQPVMIEWEDGQMAEIHIGRTHMPVVVALGPYVVARDWWEERSHDLSYWYPVTADRVVHELARDHTTGCWTRTGVAD